jgi:hypothetical protein
MQLKLPKPNHEYKAILKDKWGVDINKDELIGKYVPSKNGTLGFFTNCTTIEGKPLKYPDDKVPLRILIWANPLKILKPGETYKFKVQFAAIDKRIELNPLLLVTQRDSVISLNGSNDLDKNQRLNGSVVSKDISGLDSVINDIYNEKLNQNNPFNVIDIAEAVEALSIDIYSENKRFIYELIQNADDAAVVDQSELMIEVKSGFVVLSHNGKPFDERDLRGLCGIGRGTKRNDEAKTGYKGIGFKSVFGQQDGLVYVKTNDLLFRFDRNHILQNGWNPKWGIQKNWEKTNQTKFKSPWQLIPILSDSTNNTDVDQILKSEEFTVKTAIKIRDESELSRDIIELFSDARFLLFLRKIHKVTFVHGNYKLCIKKESDDDIPGILSLYKNEVIISNWYLRSGTYPIPPDIKKELQEDIKSPKKLQEMIRAELSFAFKLDSDLKSISLLPSNESCIFTYLPTSVTEFGFPFLVNSNFLVDAGREKLHKDRIWNKWLFKVIGWELVKCCAEFAASIDLKQDYLKILLSNYLPETDSLKKWFNEGLKFGLEKIAFIINNDNQLVKISEIIIDEVGLLTKNIIPNQYINQFVSTNYTLPGITEHNILQIFPSSEKIKHYGAKTLSQTDLKNFLQSDLFLSNHKINYNHNLINYLRELDVNDLSGEWNYIIRNNTFIYTNEKKLEKIPLVCFPIATFVTDFGAVNTLIDKELYNSFSEDSVIIEWLKKFGVKEPSEIAYLEKEIIGKIETCIDEDNFLDVTEFILRLHAAKEIEEAHYNGLRDLHLKTNNGWAKAKDCILPAAYNPVIDFSANINGLTTVSTEYIGRYNAYEWKTLFIAIDVADDINVISNYKVFKTSNTLNEGYFIEAVNYSKSGHNYPHLIKATHIEPFYITYFTFLTKTLNFQYSLVFWDRLISKFNLSFDSKTSIRDNCGPSRDVIFYKLNDYKLKSLDLLGWGYFEASLNGHNRAFTISYFNWHLGTQKCIPTNKKTCLLASDVFTNSEKIIELGGDYIPIIQVPKVLSKEWIQLIGLKSKLTLADMLNILSSINNDTNEKGYFKRDNIRRLGLLYNEIINGLNELTIQEEKEIKDWAKRSKFLCKDFISRKTSEVIWLRIEGFNKYNDKIPSILIPKNVTVDDKVGKLFSLFEIPIVDKCDYKVEEEKEDVKLSIKILEFLPALSLILRSRMKITDEEDYLNKAYKSVENFKFYICKEILLILNYGDSEINGSSVKYYLSDKGFYFTNSWENPLERFNISHYLASFLKCNGLEQEIQLLLELSDYQIIEYLESIGFSLEILKTLPIYAAIQEKIISLKELNRPSKSNQANSSFEFGSSEKETNSVKQNNQDAIPKKDIDETEYDFIKEVENFISTELENTEWAEHIPELKNILELSKSHPKEKQKLYNLIAKLKLAKATIIQFDTADKDYNQLINGNEKYFVHSARGSFAYIHTNEIIRMRDEGFKMALDFGSKTPIKIYQTAEEILSLNTSHLLAYQYDKTMDDLFNFCEHNRDANKHLLVIDRDNSRDKSNDIFKLLNPEDDYQ